MKDGVFEPDHLADITRLPFSEIVVEALDAVVHTTGPGGDRQIPLTTLHLPPGETPNVETVLRRYEPSHASKGLPPDGVRAHGV